MSTTFTTENTLEGISIKDPNYFTAENDWSLLGFLLYRQQCSDFLPNKSEEHHRYSLNLREIMGCEETPVHLLRRAGRAISSIQTEKKSQLIDEFWKSATSMQRRKIEAVAEREALLEEHTTNAVYSVYSTSRNGRIVQEKLTRRLEDTDLGLQKKDNEPNFKRKKIEDFFPVRAVTPSTDMNNDYTDHAGEKSVPLSPPQDAEGEEEPTPPLPKSRIPVEKSCDSFMIDEIDIAKCFSSLRKSLPKTNHEVHPQYWGILDLTGQHKPTKKMLWKKWNYLVDDFRVDVGWKMIGLDQSELDFFDNMEDLEVQQTLPILNAHLTILKSYLEYLKLPLNEGELMIRFVAPAFNMSLDPNQEKFRKHWSEQQLIASQERRREGQDPNNERARAGQKTDIIIDLPTGPALEGFICEVSGGLPAGCPKKIWTDKLKLMVGMRDMINRIMKTFPGLLSTDYMKVVVFGCQVIGLQMNLYAMDVRNPGIYRFGIVDKVSLPASAKELPTYEAVHLMLRSLEHRLSDCTALKVKHSKLRRKRNYVYQEDSLAFSNNTPNSSPKIKLPNIRS
ncbi:unnamed protein product [Rhizophagus irregularis]|uniref:Uncharacterized protein n=3 Tax=Rhizophagus irregularis TaxID=588596 RepID=A0A915ZPA3_9GLOM|nr:unnamed protein product [Rhizophagus irregularis]CAB5381942.1 unnamed protein product [Rhizophagus irregularis]